MDKSAEGNLKKATSTPQTDDESITTSTESDSLDTWTLVNGKNKKNLPVSSTDEENRLATNVRIEILNKFEDPLTSNNQEIHDNADSRTDDDSNVDDISEGISIISESESAGRASPLAIAENLNSVDLGNISNREDVSMLRLPIRIPQSSYSLPSSIHPPDENSIRQRRIRRSSSTTNSERKAIKLQNDRIANAKLVYPLVRRGLKGVFFICVALAILVFIGKLRNPDWQPFSDLKNLSVLEQKLTDLELQNNLMRAEIDILSKQVNYLSSGRINRDKAEKEPKQQQRPFKQTGEWIMKQKGKSFKVWPGNGESLDPVQITKDELKKPYKCPSGKFVEIANMCIEKSEQNIKNVEDILNLNVDDIVVEQLVESMQSLKEQSGAAATAHASVNKKDRNGYKAADEKNTEKYFIKDENRNSKEHVHHSFEKKYDTQKHWKQHKHLRRDKYDDNDGDDFSEEDAESLDDSFEGFDQQKFTSKEKYKKREHDDGDKYKDRHQNDRHCKERSSTGNSKENLYVSSDEQSRKNGEWHGKLMQQRANARLQNEYRQSNKNWFIERGDSREKMRHRR